MNTESFKILGVSYAIYKLYEENCITKDFSGLLEYFEKKQTTFVTATDGNFGVALSYLGKILKQKCIVYIPRDTPEFYLKRIKSNGANVVLVEGNYDDSVEMAISNNQKNGMNLVLDTAIEGRYLDTIPENVIKGYSTIFFESKLKRYDYIFLPAGVGGLVAAAIQCSQLENDCACKVISVEPSNYNCIQQSIGKEHPIMVKGKNTVMNGLKCGLPSYYAWKYINGGLYGSVSIDDSECIKGKKELEKNGIRTGYTGSSAYAGYLAFKENNIESLKEKKVLILNTEFSDY